MQRVLAHEDIFVALRRELVAAAEAVRFGDPSDEGVICGPVIDKANADRVARLDLGSHQRRWPAADRRRTRRQHDQPHHHRGSPTRSARSWPTRSSGPVACLDPYEDFAQALNMVNDSRYGLQAGIFTSDISKIHEAWQHIEAGGIIQGDVPTWRTDPMPYGGVKGSGVGREGPAYTYRELTEERLLVLKG